MTDFTLEAQEILRDPSNFGWYTVALLALVLYVYAVEVERRRFDVVFAGLAVWLADWINEIANALVLHFTDRAAVWTVTGDTSYLILIGLTIEISFMFAISGIVYVKLLPPDPRTRILGVPNRLAVGLALSLVAVGVEVLLHDAGVFHWEYWWWNWPFFPAIVVFGYLWFFLLAGYVYDMRDVRRQARLVGVMAAVVAAAVLVFGVVLEWI
ncbi:MAG TPA: hypothetical protein VK920_12115 [Solirubrobacterales bacterium]|nr:hypothetical protein [Solirubrobacterales bacterium]